MKYLINFTFTTWILCVCLILNNFSTVFSQTSGYNIQILVHVVRDNSGNYGLDVSEVQQAIDNLNDLYRETGNETDIQFMFNSLTDIDYINESYFTSGNPINFKPVDWVHDAKLVELFGRRNQKGVIHLFFIAKQFTTQFADGVVEDIPGNKIVLTNEAALLATTLAHEVAHCLGLLHTYETTKLNIRPTNLKKWSGGGTTDSPEWVNRSGACANWSTNGDMLEHTPADPIVNSTVISRFISNCTFSINPNERDNSPCLTVYNNVLIHNIMALNTGCTRDEFTNDQIQRMHDFLDDRLLYLKNTVETTIANKFDDSIIPDDENQISTLTIDDTEYGSNSTLYLTDGEHTGKTNQERFENYQSNNIKHNDWDRISEVYHLSEEFQASELLPTRDAVFQPMNTINYINALAENTLTINNGDVTIEFKDPWYLFAGDVQKDDQDDAWITNDDPSWLTGAYNESAGGIFLDEDYDPAFPIKPYYSVRVPVSQQIQINNRQHSFYLYEWTANSAVTIVEPNDRETPVVFNGSNSTISAILKGTNLSDDTKAYDNNSQRKFVRTGSGDLHSVYASLGALWYERSTDGGNTWEIMNNGSPLNRDNPKGVSICST